MNLKELAVLLILSLFLLTSPSVFAENDSEILYLIGDNGTITGMHIQTKNEVYLRGIVAVYSKDDVLLKTLISESQIVNGAININFDEEIITEEGQSIKAFVWETFEDGQFSMIPYTLAYSDTAPTPTAQTATPSATPETTVPTAAPETAVPTAAPTDSPPDMTATPIGDGIIHLMGTYINADGIENVTVTGTNVEITAAGTYTIEGTLLDGRILINTPEKSDEVKITLNGVNVSSSTTSPFNAANGKVKVTLTDGTTNTFTDAEIYTSDTTPNACFYSRRDLSITKNGTGKLIVNGNNNNGIGTKADLKINAGELFVTAPNNAVKGNDTVTIQDGVILTTNSAGDGIKTDNPDEAEDGNGVVTINGGDIDITTTLDGDGIQADINVIINGGTISGNVIGDFIKSDINIEINGGTISGTTQEDGIQAGSTSITDTTETASPTSTPVSDDTKLSNITINDSIIIINCVEDALHSSTGTISIYDGTFDLTCGNDGIQAETDILIEDGSFIILSGGGSSMTTYTEDSCKGIKGQNLITINNGTFDIDSFDDSFHSDNNIIFNSGNATISTGDDGMHADNELTINGGIINIKKSYEGLEGVTLNIAGGDIHIVSSDDGINAAGGDGSGNQNPVGPGGGRPGGPGSDTSVSDETGLINITGGYTFIDSLGDGVDSNGNIKMSGGMLIVYGPTDSGNGALDYDGTFKITGGFLVAAGSSGMMQSITTSGSTINAVSITYKSKQSANTIASILNSSGTSVLSVAPTKAYSSIVFASPDLTNGDYTLYTGGSYSGGENLDAVYTGGEYIIGTSKATFNVSGISTAVSVK